MSGGHEEVFDANPTAGGPISVQGSAAIVQLIQGQLNTMIGKSSGFVETLPAQVQARIQHLRELQDKHDDYEGAYHKELKALQAKFAALYAPLYEERKQIVTGAKDVEPEQAAAPKEPAAKGAGAKAPEKGQGDEEEEVPTGIPDFWLSAMRANPQLADHITAKDEEVLEYLADVAVEDLEPEEDEDGDEMGGFKLTFTFAPNPYFDHETLTKTYFIYEEDGEPMLSRAEGTDIAWKAGKNVTVKVMKKKAKPAKGKPAGPPKMLTKSEPCASFFNFFKPPQEPEDDAAVDEEEMEDLRAALEEDYELGEAIRTRIVPHAVRWYTGEANEDDDEEDEEDEEGDEDEHYDEDEDEDDDDEDDDEDEEGGAHKMSKGHKAEALGDKGEKPPECKQQ